MKTNISRHNQKICKTKPKNLSLNQAVIALGCVDPVPLLVGALWTKLYIELLWRKQMEEQTPIQDSQQTDLKIDGMVIEAASQMKTTQTPLPFQHMCGTSSKEIKITRLNGA